MSPSASPASASAWRAHTSPIQVHRSVCTTSLPSSLPVTSNSPTSPAIVVSYRLGSKRLIRPSRFSPLVTVLQCAAASRPLGAVTPIPVITALPLIVALPSRCRVHRSHPSIADAVELGEDHRRLEAAEAAAHR